MKIRFIAAVVLCSFLVPLYGQGKAVIGLPERYKKWLDEEAIYIITPKEREVFLKLQTDKERDIFIEAFWKQRDRRPGLRPTSSGRNIIKGSNTPTSSTAGARRFPDGGRTGAGSTSSWASPRASRHMTLSRMSTPPRSGSTSRRSSRGFLRPSTSSSSRRTGPETTSSIRPASTVPKPCSPRLSAVFATSGPPTRS